MEENESLEAPYEIAIEEAKYFIRLFDDVKVFKRSSEDELLKKTLKDLVNGVEYLLKELKKESK